ncbi:nuclear transport factor 2 family protein [Spongiimicrobium salis]|uniref:nuclear transport factor 2 family protein n=1 Tax=Spongiimicrobium salis TaxID=1667022 RepID=UPI00374CBED5
MRIALFACIGLFFACANSATEKELQQQIEQLKAIEIMKEAIGNRNKNSVKEFFKVLENENISGLVNLFAEDGKHINPYHSGIFLEGAVGKEAIKAYWTPVFSNFDGMTFPIEEIYAMEDPQVVFVQYTGNIKLKNNAGIYRNDYYSIFKFNSDGKIKEYVELFNPIIAARSFGLLDEIK